MPALTIRIDIDGRGRIGPGKVDLLEAVDRSGSIRGAAKAIGMSYRRAWLLLKDIEAVMGTSALLTSGAGGKGALLSPMGRAIIRHYRAIEKRAQSAAAADLKTLIGLTSASKFAAQGKQAKRLNAHR